MNLSRSYSIFKVMFSLAIALVTIGCSSISDKRKNAHNAYQSADYDSAYSQFLELAEKGDSSSQFSLGLMYSEGKGVEKNNEQAKHWYRLAIENNHSGAMNNYALILEREGKRSEAIEWYTYSSRWMNGIADENLRRLGQPVPEPDLKLQSLDHTKQKRSESMKWTIAVASLLSSDSSGFSSAFDDYSTPPSDSNLLLFESNGSIAAYISFRDKSAIFDWDGNALAYLIQQNKTHIDVYGFNGKHLGWYENKALFDEDGYAVCVSADYLKNTYIDRSNRAKQRLPYQSYRQRSPYKPEMKKYYSDLTCIEFLQHGAK